jgi:hypothetical protein
MEAEKDAFCLGGITILNKTLETILLAGATATGFLLSLCQQPIWKTTRQTNRSKNNKRRCDNFTRSPQDFQKNDLIYKKILALKLQKEK